MALQQDEEEGRVRVRVTRRRSNLGLMGRSSRIKKGKMDHEPEGTMETLQQKER